MDTLKNIWRQLWDNKPLLITVAVALAVLLYFAWQSFAVPAGTTGPGVLPDGTLPDQGPTFQPPGSPPLPPAPGPGSPGSPPLPPAPFHAPPSGGPPKPPPKRTVTVTPWPTKHSTLWGIAQDMYGNPAQWPKIYQANKSKIGSNPNLLHPGMVLVIP